MEYFSKMKTAWILCMLVTIKCVASEGEFETPFDKDKTPDEYNVQMYEEDTEYNVSRAKRSSTSGLVDIAMLMYDSTRAYSVYVDDTMTRLIFSVAVDRTNPIIGVTKPSGSPYTTSPVKNGTASQGTVVATLDIPITPADYGVWKFSKLDASKKWDIIVKGEGLITITHRLFELGTNTPVLDYPITGKSYKLEVTVDGIAHVSSVDFGFLYAKDKSNPVSGFALVNTGNNTYEAAKVTMGSEALMVGIQGKDKSNHMFKRLDTNEMIPVSVKLDVPIITGYLVEEYKSINISFTITNIMATTQDIDIRIEDDMGLIQPPKYVRASGIKAGENYTGNFQLTAGKGGMTTLVKIQARQIMSGGSFSSGPTVWKNVTVFEKTTTTTTTTSTTTPPPPTTTTPQTKTTTSSTTQTTIPTTPPPPPTTAPTTTAAQTTTAQSPTQPTATNSTPSMSVNSEFSLDVDIHNTDGNNSSGSSKSKDSLLLMFLKMSDIEDKSVRININN